MELDVTGHIKELPRIPTYPKSALRKEGGYFSREESFWLTIQFKEA